MENSLYAISGFIYGKDMRSLRKRLKLTQAKFAELVCVSAKTVERWETGNTAITGPIVSLCKILQEQPELAEKLRIQEKEYPLRLFYMYRQELCTVIDVDILNRRIKIKNYTSDFLFRAFGKIENPSFEQYEAFLESRCFPKERDKMKLMLRELDIPFYDPFLIIEKTQGRMAEDEFWIKIVQEKVI